MKLEVADLSGNISCDTINFDLQKNTGVSGYLDRDTISPNGDGNYDEVEITYSLNTEADLDIKVYQGDTLVRTLAENEPNTLGDHTITWNGKDNSGRFVADGNYDIQLEARGFCNTESKKIGPISVDRTPPTVAIFSPAATDQLGIIKDIFGLADDKNFKEYQLTAESLAGGKLLIAQNNSPHTDNTLPVGTWNTYGLEGTWTLKLAAWDKLANYNEDTVTLDLGARVSLIANLAATPRLFSPNVDGHLETTTINYKTLNDCDITISVSNNGQIKRTYAPTTSLPAGEYSWEWDGKDNNGARLPDDTYFVKLTAKLSSNAQVMQEETITVVIDKTSPTIQFTSPTDNSYYRSSIDINGSIDDPHFAEYNVTYTGSSATMPIDSGNQAQKNHIFTTFDDLEDGPYSLEISAKDQAENIAEQTIAFTVDTVAPILNLETPLDNEMFGHGKEEIVINGSIIEANLDFYDLRYGSGQDPTEWKTLRKDSILPQAGELFRWPVGIDNGIEDGLYTISLYAEDKAGWKKEVKVIVNIDNTPPEANVSSPAANDFVKGPQAILGTAADINIDKYEVAFSEGSCESAYQWTPLKQSATQVENNILAQWHTLPDDGQYCLRVVATDKLGNTGEDKVGFVVDTTPPGPPVLSGSVANKTDAAVSWTANTEPDLAGYNLYRDGVKVNSNLLSETTYSDPALKESIYSYVVRAVDLAGWESEPSNEIKLRIDITGPTVHLGSPADNDTVNALVDIKGTAFSLDDFKEYRVYVGAGANPATWSLVRKSPVPVSFGLLSQWDTFSLGEGALYAIKLEGEDLVGNISEDTVLVTIDNQPPAAPVLTSAVPTGADVALNWEANAEDDLAGYLLFRNNNLANVEGIVIGDMSPYLITDLFYIDQDLADGKYSYYLVAVDDAGNQSDNSLIKEVEIDTHAPQAVIVNPADGAVFEQTLMIKAESRDRDVAAVQFQYKAANGAWLDLGSAITSQPFVNYLNPIDLGLTFGNYRLRAIATDFGGRSDDAPAEIAVVYTDLTPPEIPVALKAKAREGEVYLSWQANTEADLTGYNIYRVGDNGLDKLNSGPVATNLFVHQQQGGGELADNLYFYVITAIDSSGNESRPSGQAMATVFTPDLAQPFTPTTNQTLTFSGNTQRESAVAILKKEGNGFTSLVNTTADMQGDFSSEITLQPGENIFSAQATDLDGNISKKAALVPVVWNEPPAMPTGLTAVQENYVATLNWDANTEEDLVGYNVFRDGEKLNANLPANAKNIIASSYSWSNVPQNAFDNNVGTFWFSRVFNDTFQPSWWEIEFPQSELISQVGILWFDSLSGKDFELQAWTGYTWLPIKKVIGNVESGNVLNIEPAYRTRKLRIYITKPQFETGDMYVGIGEVSIVKQAPYNQETFTETVADGNYSYQVSAVDFYGLESPRTDSIGLTVGDVIAPASPINLTASSLDKDITLAWSAGTEADLAGYNVYRKTVDNWGLVNQSGLIAGNVFVDDNLPNGLYTYRVTAVDNAGNESPPSNEAVATIFAALPPPPTGLAVTSAPEGGALNLSWSYSGAIPSSYSLYRGTTHGGPYAKITSTASTDYQDTGLTNGVTYYYVVTAVDGVGNESSYSLEAHGMPAMVIDLVRPVIMAPTISGIPIHAEGPVTDVAGFADPAVNINLINNDQNVGRTSTSNENNTQTFYVNNYIEESSIAADGKFLAYDDGWSLYLKDMATGLETTLAEDAWSPQWSPDGSKLAYIHADRDAGDRIYLYDAETGSSSLLTDAPFAEELSPSWSADGRSIVFVQSIDGPGSGVRIKNLDTGMATTLLENPDVETVSISPDGRKIAFANRQTMSVMDIDSGVITEIGQSWQNYFTWSPDSNKLAYISYNQTVAVFNIETGVNTTVEVSPVPKIDLHWSPDGNYLLYGLSTPFNSEIVIAPFNLQAEKRQISLWLYNLRISGWSPAGDIYYTSGDEYAVYKMQPAGSFVFKNVALDVGENHFTAVSSDYSGNVSGPAEEIIVNLDAARVPDLEVLDGDIFLYPLAPVAGDQMAIGAAVRNKCLNDLTNVDVAIYLKDSAGNFELLFSTTLASISANGEEYVDLLLDTGLYPGLNTLYAVVDENDTIVESVETNNLAIKDFYVSPVGMEGNVGLGATLNKNDFTVNDNLTVSVNIFNSGMDQDVRMQVALEDLEGYPVTDFGPIATTLSYGAVENYSYTWNTDRTFAGQYQARVTLLDKTGLVIDEKLLPFTIVPDIAFSGNLALNRTHFKANETVFLSGTITNTGLNYIASEAEGWFIITDSAGNEIFTDQQGLINLLPGSAVTAKAEWHTELLPPGNYAATLEVVHNGLLAASDAVPFTIDPVVNLTGTLAADTPVVFIGNGIGANFTVLNSGNAEAVAVDVSVSIVDPATLAVIEDHEQTVDLGLMVDVSGQVAFTGSALHPGNYQMVLKTTWQGETRILATTSFVVKDGTPPVVSIISPAVGSIAGGPFSLAVTATDNATGISKVEYQVEGGNWLPLPAVNPATGKYGRIWKPVDADEGRQTVAYRAVDGAGNGSEPVSVTFTIEFVHVAAQLATDQAHYGPDQNIRLAGTVTNEAQYRSMQGMTAQLRITAPDSTIVFEETQPVADLAPGEAINLDAVWNSGLSTPGNYTAALTITNNNEAVAEAAAVFIIDPVVILNGGLSVAPEAVAQGDMVEASYSVSNSGNIGADNLALQIVATENTSQTVVHTDEPVIDLAMSATNSGIFSFPTTNYNLGDYTINLLAVHDGSSETLAAATFKVIDITPPELTIISPVNGEIYTGPFAISATATDDISGVDIVEYNVDGAGWKPLPLLDLTQSQYGAIWEPVDEDEGEHNITCRATDRAGNISEPVSTNITIILKTPFERLTGTLTATPSKAYQGQQESFLYSLLNETDKEIASVTVRVRIVDPATGLEVATVEEMQDLPATHDFAGSLELSTLNLTPQAYTAILWTNQPEADGPRQLAETTFEVVPSLTIGEETTTPANLLVWVDKKCGKHHDHDHDEYDDNHEDPDDGKDYDKDDDQDRADEYHHEYCRRECYVSGCEKDECLRIDLLEQLLEEATADYMIVYDRHDFERELRNPYYTDIMVLGDHHPLKDHFDTELLELVNSGAGLIASGWESHKLFHDHDDEEVFGVDDKGTIKSKEGLTTIQLVDSPIAEAGSLMVDGRVARLESVGNGVVAAWIENDTAKYDHDEDDGKDKDDEKDKQHKSGKQKGPLLVPAIVLNDYGQGRSVFMAFDLLGNLDDNSYAQLAGLLSRSIGHVHRADVGSDAWPWRMAPITQHIENLGGAFDVRISRSYSPGLDLFDPMTGSWLTDNPWLQTLTPAPYEAVDQRFYVLLPDQVGAYSVATEVGFELDGAYNYFATLVHDFTVARDSDAFIGEIIDAVDSLAVTGKDKSKPAKVVKYLRRTRERNVNCAGDIDKNIHDLAKAVKYLLKIETVDVRDVRLMLDRLLRMEQGRYYFFVPPIESVQGTLEMTSDPALKARNLSFSYMLVNTGVHDIEDLEMEVEIQHVASGKEVAEKKVELDLPAGQSHEGNLTLRSYFKKPGEYRATLTVEVEDCGGEKVIAVLNFTIE